MATCAGVEWGLSKEQEAAISGIVFAGILVGSLFWGIVADRYGRKRTFLVACLTISLFGVLSGLAPNYVCLIIFRALVGFGIGGANVPFDLLAEFLPTSHRGTFLVYIEYFWSIGSLFVAGLAWTFLSSHGWRFLTLLTAVPVTITSVVSIAYLPESPRWLLVKGRKTDAERVVRDAALVNGIHMSPFTLSSESESDGQVVNSCGNSYLNLFRTKEMRSLSLPLCSVWFLFGLTYYGLLVFVGRLYLFQENQTISSSSVVCFFDYSAIFINSKKLHKYIHS
jgi:MFS family permease